MSGRERRVMKRALFGTYRSDQHEFDHDGFAALAVFTVCLVCAMCWNWHPVVAGVALGAMMLGLQVAVNIRADRRRRAASDDSDDSDDDSDGRPRWWMLAGLLD